MTYAVQTWTDYDPTSPVSAARMTHIEQGIAAAHALVPVFYSDGVATYDISTNNVETALHNGVATLLAGVSYAVTIAGQHFAFAGAPVGLVGIRAWAGSGARWEDATATSGGLKADAAVYQPFMAQFKLTAVASGQVDLMGTRISGTGTLRLQNLSLRLDPLG